METKDPTDKYGNTSTIVWTPSVQIEID